MGLQSSRGFITQHGGCDLGLRYLAALLRIFAAMMDDAALRLCGTEVPRHGIHPDGDPDPRLRPSRRNTQARPCSFLGSFVKHLQHRHSSVTIDLQHPTHLQQPTGLHLRRRRSSGVRVTRHMGGSGRQGGRNRREHKGTMVGLPGAGARTDRSSSFPRSLPGRHTTTATS